jgi:hypothetical protein
MHDVNQLTQACIHVKITPSILYHNKLNNFNSRSRSCGTHNMNSDVLFLHHFNEKISCSLLYNLTDIHDGNIRSHTGTKRMAQRVLVYTSPDTQKFFCSICSNTRRSCQHIKYIETWFKQRCENENLAIDSIAINNSHLEPLSNPTQQHLQQQTNEQ